MNDIIIVASTGSLKALAKPALVEKEYQNIQIGAFLRILRPREISSWPYLSYIIHSDYFHDNIISQAKGININNIKNNYITDILIPLPPLSEQRRIVTKLEELLQEIDKLKA